MTWTQTTLSIKDAAGVNQPVIAYTDGTNFSFAHPLLDNTGAIIAPATAGLQTTGNTSLSAIATSVAAIPSSPATSGKQDTGNTSLGTIATNTTGVSTAANQATANTSLASIATSTGDVDTNLGAKADSAASTDTGTFSLIALFKRLLSTSTTLVTNTTGLATAANQSTASTSLGTIATAVQAATPAGTNLIGKVGFDQTTPGTTNGVQVNAALPAGTNTIGSVSQAANTSGGASTYSATGGTGNALLTNTAVAVKASAGNLYGLNAVNTGAAAAYVQLFDVASGSVTLGTTVPKLSFWVPANGSFDKEFVGEAKIAFATAITIAATTTATGGTAPGTGILANINYK